MPPESNRSIRGMHSGQNESGPWKLLAIVHSNSEQPILPIELGNVGERYRLFLEMFESEKAKLPPEVHIVGFSTAERWAQKYGRDVIERAVHDGKFELGPE